MEKNSDSGSFVTTYSLCFKGLFGRNRSVKFTSSENAKLEGPAAVGVPAEAYLGLRLALDKFLNDIKAKAGRGFVVLYANTEVNSYYSAVEGRDVETFIIPVTQGVRVLERTVA